MGYMHIENLYRPEAQRILEFKRLYALEKIHGTSAHVRWNHKGYDVGFHSGGESHSAFCALFDIELLKQLFHEHFPDASVVIHGEAYGGKCQGMRNTYGDKLRFIAFDVKVGDNWLAVPQAEDVASKLSIPFVFYQMIDSTLEAIDAARDRESEQAKRNGITEPRIAEGIVLRPPFEVTLNNGSRLIAKHKRAEFAERKTIPAVDPTKLEMMEKADEIAAEWVTPMRLAHVLDKLGNPSSHRDIPAVIAAMVEDVCREASGEIVDNKAVRKAIGAAAVKLYKAKIETVRESLE